ncbi:MAG: DUF3857 and transglutaminase domain-containing protein [Bacteroidales bacterium]|nr:DUF3857 and transglutaminase domain-containing protein [Bacteroidales bacterium]
MYKKQLFFSLILAFFTFSASAQSVTELIKKYDNTQKYKGYNLLLIFDSTKVDVHETGLSYNNKHTLYKVLTYKGAKKLSNLKFDYDPQSAFVEIKKVVIYKKDGTKKELDINTVLDYPAPAHMIYWGARQKMIEVGRLEPGDAVEVMMFKKGFTYALLQDGQNNDDRYIPPMKGQFYDIVPFWNSNPIAKKVYQVKVPKEKYFQYKFYNGVVDSAKKQIGDKIQYTFTKTNILPIRREQRSLGLSDIAPKLLLSTSRNWEEKSVWFNKVNEDYGSFESTKEIDEKVDEILQGAKDEMDSVSRLTHWVGDEIRYSGISMGEGEGFTLHKGEMNFRDRCGVCKDKAGMLITMLRAAGFTAYPAMTMAGSRIENIPADQFNHCVVVAKLSDKKYHLLDPTWVPFVRELWSSCEQQQNYLMGLPEGADLKETPISAPENHLLKIIGNSEISNDGTLTGEVILTATGQSDASLRGVFNYSKKSQWKENVEKQILAINPLAEIVDMKYTNTYDYQKTPVEIKVKFRIPDYAIISENEMIFKPFAAQNVFKYAQSQLRFNTDLNERKYGFKDRCSRLVEINETIKLPKFESEIYLPKADSSDGSGASFVGSYTLKENTLVINEKVSYKKRVYSSEDWQSFKQAIKSQNKFADEYVILKIK